MTKKTFKSVAILVIISIFLISALSVIFIKNSGQTGFYYKVQTFRCSKGWGYDIIENEKTIIHQPYIPCIEEAKSFPDKKSAMNAGKLVLSKIQNQEIPSITIEEISTILNQSN